MDEFLGARLALSRAIDDVQLAMARVRAAQQVDWVSVLAGRYREELYGALLDLGRLRESLESMRASRA